MQTRAPRASSAQLLFFVMLAAGTALPPTAFADDQDDNVIESFEVAKNGEVLVIPVKIGGRQCRFVVDTGCSMTVFDKSLAKMLVPTGKKIPANGGSSGDFELFECHNGTVGMSKLPLSKLAVCADLTAFQDSQPNPPRGLLGMDFLRNYVVQIDFDSGRLALLKSSAGAPGKKIDMERGEFGVATAAVELPEIGTTPFIIDTGAAGLESADLAEATFQELLRANVLSDVATGPTAFSIDGYSDRRGAIVPWMSVGGFRHTQQALGERRGANNWLGLRYLSRYKVTLDFPNQTLYLEKGKHFDAKIPFAFEVGLQIGRADGALVVEHAEEDGLAYKSGVRVGQRLLEIDGRDTRDMTPYAAMVLLFRPSDGFPLKVQLAGNAPQEVRLYRGEPPQSGQAAQR